jgi:hypothetical protein
VAVGKKFVGDPDVWAIVDGRLYLNLDNNIQGLWSKDVPGYIKQANAKLAPDQEQSTLRAVRGLLQGPLLALQRASSALRTSIR